MPAVLRVAVEVLVRWPDGAVELAWVLPAGSVVNVEDVFEDAAGGWHGWVHQDEVPEVFAVVALRDLDLVHFPVPF